LKTRLREKDRSTHRKTIQRTSHLENKHKFHLKQSKSHNLRTIQVNSEILKPPNQNQNPKKDKLGNPKNINSLIHTFTPGYARFKEKFTTDLQIRVEIKQNKQRWC